jgi:hypothetical protein
MILLTLNSDNRSNGFSYDFTTSFQPNLRFDDDCLIAVHSLQMWNSLPNISVSRNNNTFRFYNGATWSSNITIPTGNYSIDDLNIAIQTLITTNGGVGSNIVITPNYNTLKSDILLKNSYRLDLSIGTLYLVLGWAQAIVSVSGSGNELVDISNNITSYQIHCSLVDSSTSISNGSSSDVIYSFSPDKPAGNLLSKEIINLIYIKCNSNYISSMRIYITDQKSNLLTDLSNENISITMIIKDPSLPTR